MPKLFRTCSRTGWTIMEVYKLSLSPPQTNESSLCKIPTNCYHVTFNWHELLKPLSGCRDFRHIKIPNKRYSTTFNYNNHNTVMLKWVNMHGKINLFLRGALAVLCSFTFKPFLSCAPSISPIQKYNYKQYSIAALIFSSLSVPHVFPL